MGDIRNVQKTGNMFYVYLPTSWCRKFKISSDSQVQVEITSEGKLNISSTMEPKKPKHLELNIDETDMNIINKIIVACYLSPAGSFKINLKTPLDQAKLLDQKRLVSIELVEIEGNSIICESDITSTDPRLLLKTIISKIRNMIVVMTGNYNKELVERYEEEIDRNKILINKSIISSLTFQTPLKTKIIDLFYISHITRDLERVADHIIKLDKTDKKYLEKIWQRINEIRDMMENINKSDGFDHAQAISFSKSVSELEVTKMKSPKDYEKRRIGSYLHSISEVIMDWAITQQIEKHG